MSHHPLPLKVRVPGKLLLAGEYAVLETGSLALVLGINRYLTVEVSHAPQWTLISELWPVPFLWRPGCEVPDVLRFAAGALDMGWHWLQSELEAIGPLSLTIHSELNLPEGPKLGLGSSAAVTVAVLAGLLAALGRDLSDAVERRQLFKCALLSHRLIQGSGSGADIAGCIYGSVCAYNSPDFQTLPLHAPLAQVLASDWRLLGLEKLSWPKAWGSLSFGWTGTAADTAPLVEDYRHWKRQHPEAHEEFLFDASMSTLGLREAILANDPEQLIQSLSRCRRVLKRLDGELFADRHAGDDDALETPALAALADCAETLGGAGKFSGAGGGDCGLAWVPLDQTEALHQAWREAGIEPLELALDTHGVQLT